MKFQQKELHNTSQQSILDQTQAILENTRNQGQQIHDLDNRIQLNTYTSQPARYEEPSLSGNNLMTKPATLLHYEQTLKTEP